MTHRKFEFSMPAGIAVVFDAFHHSCWRRQWDSLVSATHILGDAPCPFVGAISTNAGAGALRGLSMTTEFISYDRPHGAAAKMIGASFPFSKWAASMRHQNTGAGQSLLIYTYSFEAGPTSLAWVISPFVKLVFDWQTRRRFARLHKFLSLNSAEVAKWQEAHLTDSNVEAGGRF